MSSLDSLSQFTVTYWEKKFSGEWVFKKRELYLQEIKDLFKQLIEYGNQISSWAVWTKLTDAHFRFLESGGSPISIFPKLPWYKRIWFQNNKNQPAQLIEYIPLWRISNDHR